ncbi:response regulator transcription factor [Sphingobacterium corticibacterium]|uniref:Response regulator transcription factor n=1 Tax=Sphingobacterium corticibacterium TaxID=2484746 RepID=A0A4Q6XZX1_9SPHI|nr:response regulator transcription factor [Sphingobacterium corticibacterium]RZF62479.1 response regulator transcription factor [Sphingobacterium corticibacterium]
MTNTKHIAIVDDHALFRKGLAGLINGFPGYNVILEASNGRDLIHRLQEVEQLPDIALLDISMPEMDGYATAEWLRINHPSIKILALSTMDAESAIIKMIRHGAKGYVLKDAEPSELKRAFEEVLTVGYFFNELITHKVLFSIQALTEASDIQTFVKLTDREITFLKQICSEKSYAEIADEMCVSVRTVEGYRNAVCEKLQLKTRTGLAMYAIKNGIVKLD